MLQFNTIDLLVNINIVSIQLKSIFWKLISNTKLKEENWSHKIKILFLPTFENFQKYKCTIRHLLKYRPIIQSDINVTPILRFKIEWSIPYNIQLT